MSLVRWNPTRELAAWPSDLFTMQRDINRMFDNFFRGDTSHLTAWTPAVDVAESDADYIVKVELPGVQKEDVKITVESNTLTIRGEKKQQKEAKKENYYSFERSFGAFERSFSLPASVMNNKIDASYTDGILTITLPKSTEAQPKQIEVKVK
jgi:HSP20 family protein